MKTILITGASAGIGRAAALYFANKGWQVLATMRRPEQEQHLTGHSNIDVQRLDVTDAHNIRQVVANAIAAYGQVHAVVNNAGMGVFGVFEGATAQQIELQFNTNVFGTMNVIREVLPHFRANRSGVIVNISSGVGQVAVPVLSLYNSTKYAVEGFSESLQYELAPMGIRVKLVLPGHIRTNFFTSMVTTSVEGLPDYQAYHQHMLAKHASMNNQGVAPEVVARVIYRAVTDGRRKLRYLAGPDVKLFLAARKLLPDALFFRLMKSQLK